MNIEKIRSRKALKFLGLLISAMIIATVSAGVYNYMYIQGSGTASTATGLIWELGAVTDYPAGTNIDGFTVENLNFTTNASPRNYTDCLHIKNQDPTENHTFNLRVKSSWGGWSDYTEFNLVVFNATTGGTQQAALDLSSQGEQTANMTIPQGATWRILFEIVPISSPTGTQVFFEIELTYESAA